MRNKKLPLIRTAMIKSSPLKCFAILASGSSTYLITPLGVNNEYKRRAA